MGLHLQDNLAERVIGQPAAVKAVADAVLRSRAGLARKEQPSGSFLFLGPTGVGKTELAKTLAVELFDSERQMVRIDMSEYMESHAVARLIGAPPGYVGHEAGGQLTEAVRRSPYTIVLLDEIEKAHVDVLNVLLQVLDDGHLTDGKGRTVDFTNTVVIMTSNVGAQALLSDGGAAGCMEAVKRTFRPEFINRVGAIVMFEKLGTPQLRAIVRQQVQEVESRLKDKGITLLVEDSACDCILEESYDPQYGARPVRRYVEGEVVTELSRKMIEGSLHENSTVRIKRGLGRDSLDYCVELPAVKRARMVSPQHGGVGGRGSGMRYRA